MNYRFATIVPLVTALFFPLQGAADAPVGRSAFITSNNLSDALFKIGATPEEIGEMTRSGTPPIRLVKTFNNYIGESNAFRFKSLTFAQRNALIKFACILRSKGFVSDTSFQMYMTNEKIRAGMPKAHIKEVYALARVIAENPNYVVSPEGASIINDAAPYINDQPFAFCDVLGSFVKPLLDNDPNGIALTWVTQDILIKAARTVIGLSQSQIDNLTALGKVYNTDQTFDGSAANVGDMEALSEVAYYPEAANLLLPFIGGNTLIYASRIHGAYPALFPRGEPFDLYAREVAASPVVRSDYARGIAPRYTPYDYDRNRQDAIDNRASVREDRAGDRSLDREDRINGR